MFQIFKCMPNRFATTVGGTGVMGGKEREKGSPEAFSGRRSSVYLEVLQLGTGLGLSGAGSRQQEPLACGSQLQLHLHITGDPSKNTRARSPLPSAARQNAGTRLHLNFR